MKIAVTHQNGQIFQHFGKTEQFKIYETEDNLIKSINVIPTNGKGHGALAGFLKENEVDVLICGGIGGGAISALEEAGIKICAGVSGDTNTAVLDYINGKLVYSNQANCSHHEHEEGHSCGEHGCH